ncbi:unnamed protein product, partial [Ectocarpus sp. 13 AM-2016]
SEPVTGATSLASTLVGRPFSSRKASPGKKSQCRDVGIEHTCHGCLASFGYQGYRADEPPARPSEGIRKCRPPPEKVASSDAGVRRDQLVRRCVALRDVAGSA